MVGSLRSWWQQTRKSLVVIWLIVAFVVIILLILEISFYGTGFARKTLWEWLQLLIIPVVLAAGGYLFTFTISRNERKAADRHNQTEREIAQDNQREAALQAYIDKMSELLLHEKLRESVKGDDEVRNVARVRTLTVLPRLDPIRKARVLQFLYESGLIDRGKPVVDLNGTDLSGADLWRANLSGANLSRTDLSGADLRYTTLIGAQLIIADLSGAFLNGTYLSGADLFEAKLRGTDLSGAYLMPVLSRISGANLVGADLSGANLSGAVLSGAELADALVTPEQLDQAKSLKGTTMPDGSIHP
jgi:hypothetical protein